MFMLTDSLQWSGKVAWIEMITELVAALEN